MGAALALKQGVTDNLRGAFVERLGTIGPKVFRTRTHCSLRHGINKREE